MEEIELDYKPRDIFLPYHESVKRFCLTIAHRRCGKTVARINKLIRSAVDCPLLNPRFGYLAPSYVQAKDIAWAYLKYYSAPITALGGRINESELSVVLPHNNATIRLYGAENAERMNGIYFDGIAIDEAQLIPTPVLTTIILPALADRKGWLDVTGKPRGWQNMLGELYKRACNDDEWFVQVLKASDTHILDDDELANQRKLMSDDEYNQEFECSFDAAIGGSVYGKWMQAAMETGRITDRVEYDPKFPVFTAWDLGYSDTNTIWFYQVGNGEIYIIDYYEYSGEGIGYYCDIVKGKGDTEENNLRRSTYRYAAYYVPIDATFELQAANGRSMLEQAWNPHGIRMTAIPECQYIDAIESVRVTLPRCWFNETRCAVGIESLQNWHFEWDAKRRMYKDKPRHDGFSHACRAFDILARMWTAKVLTIKDMDSKQKERDFFRKRRQYSVDKNEDPYRLRSKV